MAIPLIPLLGAWAGADFLKGAMGMGLNYSLGKQQLSLQDKLQQGQLAGMKAGNEANRQAAQEYLTMLREEKTEQRKDKNWDRQLQLVMMMLQGQRDFSNQVAQSAMTQNLPVPPMAMTTLLKGL
jgi:hypothetical protein